MTVDTEETAEEAATFDVMAEFSGNAGVVVIGDDEDEGFFGAVSRAEIVDGRVFVNMGNFGSGEVVSIALEGSRDGATLTGTFSATMKDGSTVTGSFTLNHQPDAVRGNLGGEWDGVMTAYLGEFSMELPFRANVTQNGNVLTGNVFFPDGLDLGHGTFEGRIVGRFAAVRVDVQTMHDDTDVQVNINIGVEVSADNNSFTGTFFQYENGEPVVNGGIEGERVFAEG